MAPRPSKPRPAPAEKRRKSTLTPFSSPCTPFFTATIAVVLPLSLKCRRAQDFGRVASERVWAVGPPHRPRQQSCHG